MQLANGIHHLAICTRDIKAQIAFFSDVLGLELVALFWMHGVPNGWHGFLRLNDRCALAFVQLPEIADIEPRVGVTHAGSGAGVSAPGTMQHVAFNVDSDAELLALRDRIRDRGINVFGPIDHGMCRSLYFAGPEHLTLEIATSASAIDAPAWIDPEVVALAGITPEELARFRAPAPFVSAGAPVPQPPIDPAKPRLTGYGEREYRKMVATPDEVLTAVASHPDPPVKSG